MYDPLPIYAPLGGVWGWGAYPLGIVQVLMFVSPANTIEIKRQCDNCMTTLLSQLIAYLSMC